MGFGNPDEIVKNGAISNFLLDKFYTKIKSSSVEDIYVRRRNLCSCCKRL